MIFSKTEEEDDSLARVGVCWSEARYLPSGCAVRRVRWATVRGPISERQLGKVQSFVGREMPVAKIGEFRVG